MIGFYSYTVILTYLSLVFAMVGIHLSVIGLYQWSFICLMMCGICDTFDGMVARSKKNRTEEEKKFGIQIDGTLMLITGILFVVDFKVPKLKGKGIIALGVLVVIELVQILCFS